MSQEKDNKPNLSREVKLTVGWISRNNLHSGRGEAECFLDTPFYRTH